MSENIGPLSGSGDLDEESSEIIRMFVLIPEIKKVSKYQSMNCVHRYIR